MTKIGDITEHPVGKDIREWKSGGKRDTVAGKLSYSKFFHPIVLRSFVEYMHKARKMRDGSYREGNNWQKGFGDTLKEHSDVCMESLMRHFMDVWLFHEGTEDVGVDLDEALCGVMFNAMAWLFQLLKSRQEFSMENYLESYRKIKKESLNGN